MYRSQYANALIAIAARSPPITTQLANAITNVMPTIPPAEAAVNQAGAFGVTAVELPRPANAQTAAHPVR